MANAWALPALWVGLALDALLAMGFKVSTAISKIVVVTVAPWIIGVIYGFSHSQSAKQRNQFPGSTRTTLQLKSKLGRCAIADLGFAMSCVFGATGFLQPAA
jgi:hypothetical protein